MTDTTQGPDDGGSGDIEAGDIEAASTDSASTDAASTDAGDTDSAGFTADEIDFSDDMSTFDTATFDTATFNTATFDTSGEPLADGLDTENVARESVDLATNDAVAGETVDEEAGAIYRGDGPILDEVAPANDEDPSAPHNRAAEDADLDGDEPFDDPRRSDTDDGIEL